MQPTSSEPVIDTDAFNTPFRVAAQAPTSGDRNGYGCSHRRQRQRGTLRQQGDENACTQMRMTIWFLLQD